MKRLMRLALVLYPQPWRKRYGPEVTQLIEDGRCTPADLVDLVVHAPVATTLRGEAMTMNRHLTAHPHRLAVAALAITAPTAVFVGAAVLKYVVGVPAVFDAIEPSVTPLVTHPIGETVVIVAPYVAFALAILPFTSIRVGRRHGAVTGAVEATVPVASLLVGLLSATLILFMGLYWMAENL
jgi:hypothetical protein